jgi:micrococcal nuclease
VEKRSIRSAIVGALLLFAAAGTAGSEDVLVYITETGRKYHRGDCRYLELSRIPILLSTAVSVGYEPCGHCNPPPPPPGIDPPAETRELYRLNVSGVEEPEQADLARMTRAMVVRHVDGDTVYVSIPRPPAGVRQYESVRFIGVDAPETVHPQTLVERFGEQSSEFTRRYLLNQPVFLAFDWQLRDRYDRLLAYIYLADGSCFNALLLKEGYAHAYTHYPFEFLEQFRALEWEAREQARGLWGSQEK